MNNFRYQRLPGSLRELKTSDMAYPGTVFLPTPLVDPLGTGESLHIDTKRYNREVKGEHDPNGTLPGQPGAKLDAGKPMVWLCISGFPRALAKVADVSTAGAKKYSPNGWKSVPDGEDRYMQAFGRHTLDLAAGRRIDAGTGCMIHAQMIWNLMAALELQLQREEQG